MIEGRDYKVFCGDCRSILQTLPERSVQTCVTSPPYYGLRDYGIGGQIGLEQTPVEYVAQIVNVFREVRRVLQDDGTLWLNIGDSYASFRDGKATPDTTRGNDNGTLVPKGQAKNRMASTFAGSAIKHKDLIGIPWRVAFALQADGWYLRQDIIWHKPNPMPESVTDRCTKAHEYIFLLSKSERYQFNQHSIAEPAVNAGQTISNKNGKNSRLGKFGSTRTGFLKEGGVTVKDTRNKRSVWTVSTRRFCDAHFATFPPDLIEPCVLAGASNGQTVLDPFNGSGTTGQVAIQNGRQYIGIDINPEYINMTRKRFETVLSPLFG